MSHARFLRISTAATNIPRTGVADRPFLFSPPQPVPTGPLVADLRQPRTGGGLGRLGRVRHPPPPLARRRGCRACQVGERLQCLPCSLLADQGQHLAVDGDDAALDGRQVRGLPPRTRAPSPAGDVRGWLVRVVPCRSPRPWCRHLTGRRSDLHGLPCRHRRPPARERRRAAGRGHDADHAVRRRAPSRVRRPRIRPGAAEVFARPPHEGGSHVRSDDHGHRSRRTVDLFHALRRRSHPVSAGWRGRERPRAALVRIVP